MEILRFIKWFWNDLHSSGKVLFLLITWFISTFSLALIFGPTGFVISFLILFSALVLVVLNEIRKFIASQWIKFKEEREQEAQEIINRLSGTR